MMRLCECIVCRTRHLFRCRFLPLIAFSGFFLFLFFFLYTTYYNPMTNQSLYSLCVVSLFLCLFPAAFSSSRYQIQSCVYYICLFSHMHINNAFTFCYTPLFFHCLSHCLQSLFCSCFEFVRWWKRDCDFVCFVSFWLWNPLYFLRCTECYILTLLLDKEGLSYFFFFASTLWITSDGKYQALLFFLCAMTLLFLLFFYIFASARNPYRCWLHIAKCLD